MLSTNPNTEWREKMMATIKSIYNHNILGSEVTGPVQILRLFRVSVYFPIEKMKQAYFVFGMLMQPDLCKVF